MIIFPFHLWIFFFIWMQYKINIYSTFILSSVEEASSWTTSDRDYTYEELLIRVFTILREKNPDMVAGKKQKFIMRPPQVVRIGTKKTSFANFTEVCIMIKKEKGSVAIKLANVKLLQNIRHAEVSEKQIINYTNPYRFVKRCTDNRNTYWTSCSPN